MEYRMGEYEVAVIGAGHAGIEAALCDRVGGDAVHADGCQQDADCGEAAEQHRAKPLGLLRVADVGLHGGPLDGDLRMRGLQPPTERIEKRCRICGGTRWTAVVGSAAASEMAPTPGHRSCSPPAAAPSRWRRHRS